MRYHSWTAWLLYRAHHNNLFAFGNHNFDFRHSEHLGTLFDLDHWLWGHPALALSGQPLDLHDQPLLDPFSILFRNRVPRIYYPDAVSCLMALSIKIVGVIGIEEQIGFGLKALVEEAGQLEAR